MRSSTSRRSPRWRRGWGRRASRASERGTSRPNGSRQSSTSIGNPFMPYRRLSTLFAASLFISATLPAKARTESCSAQRQGISEQLHQARLLGDRVTQTELEARLKALNVRCRGMQPLQANRLAIEQANQLVRQREAQLREALADGDAGRIELRQRQLDTARRWLEAARKGTVSQ
ncbi:DUF1090 domain-containing protein [Stutzerimonas nosocomialis]|uniref:DUF1090 domain-containing protein n=2 Tax=Stutzerimonas nosocomialis TaxID=1056496 RepID=A0A5R9QGT9_9GAMM|nr:DUF1090 domain-containing protein [Stutzerimonas nosocomialis]TLX64424.1 DUF1090 domain-containing protein [Stutzerimonas nosocomialis]